MSTLDVLCNSCGMVMRLLKDLDKPEVLQKCLCSVIMNFDSYFEFSFGCCVVQCVMILKLSIYIV